MSVDAIGAAADEAIGEDDVAVDRGPPDGSDVPSVSATGAAGDDAADEDDGGESQEGGI